MSTKTILICLALAMVVFAPCVMKGADPIV